MSGRERGRILHKFADLLEAHAEELAQLETLDNGKPIFFSRAVSPRIESFRQRRGQGSLARAATGRRNSLGHSLPQPTRHVRDHPSTG